MAIPGSGPFGISTIRETIEPGGSNSLNHYHATPNGVTPARNYPSVPASGTIAYSQFRNYTNPVTPGSMAWGGGVIENYACSVPDTFGQTAPQGQSPVGAIVAFQIPEYNDMVFTLAGAGGCSGESIWDTAALYKNGCVANGGAGTPSPATILVNGSGGLTLPTGQGVRGASGCTAVIYTGESATGVVAIAGGGQGGRGGVWHGGCDGRNGGYVTYDAATPNSSGIDGNYADARDQILTNGGAGGGASTGYLGRGGTGGGPGNPGDMVKKYFRRGGPGAPVPGQVWHIMLSYNNPYASNGGGWGRGFPGFATVSWS